MDIEEALVVLDRVMEPGCLSDIQELIFRQVLAGQTYSEIAESAGYDANYIKDTGAKLWKLLSEALGEKVSKSNLQSVLRRHSHLPHLPTLTSGPEIISSISAQISTESNSAVVLKSDWGEVLDVSIFHGRDLELATLKQWILEDRCRLVALLGMGGIGKTSLSVKLAEEIQDCFEYVIWRSLRQAPPIQDLLADVNRVLSDWEQPNPSNLREVDTAISSLIEYLRANRCLLILDNLETILRGDSYSGYYLHGYEAYGELIRRIGEARHQSCLILTSREKPREFLALEGGALPARTLQLPGLDPVACQELLADKGTFSAAATEWQTLFHHYAGNPLALKMVGAGIEFFCNGNVSEFLTIIRQDNFMFDDIQNLLERQFQRLTALEQEVVYWLTIEQEPVTFLSLHSSLLTSFSKQKLLETLRSLGQRSLIEKVAPATAERPVASSNLNLSRFTLQPVVMEYITHQLITQAAAELRTGNFVLLSCHALLKAQAKDYIREAQVRLILQPILKAWRDYVGSPQSLECHLLQHLQHRQQSALQPPDYLAGNLLNFLVELGADLSGKDFSQLTIWQTNFQGYELKQTNFANCDLASSVFTEDLHLTLAVDFSPDGQRLATGDADGKIRIWQVAEGNKLLTCVGHQDWVWAVRFSPDGQWLASASSDQTLCLWNSQTGQAVQILRGHQAQTWTVAFSPDGLMLASGSEDETIKLWNRQTGECLRTLLGHTNWVRSVAFSPTDPLLASGSDDASIRVWDLTTGTCRQILQGHEGKVWAVAFSPDGQILASSSGDGTIKLWHLASAECWQTLQGHTNWVRAIAFHPGGQYLASASEDHTVRLWGIANGRCYQMLQGHSNWVRSVAFSPDGEAIASGSGDHTIKFWHPYSGRCLRTLQGYTNRVWSVAFSPDGQILASGHDDHSVKLWELSTGGQQRSLQGHSNLVCSIAFSPDGQTLASGSEDQMIKVWDLPTGQCLRTLRGHTGRVWSVAFSPDGQTLASGSTDHAIKIWNLQTGHCLHTLQGHQNWVCGVVFSPDGQTLASAGYDQTIKLWVLSNGECLQTFAEHTNWVWSVAFSPDAQILASGSGDHTIKLWDVHTGCCLQTLQGHTSRVWSVVFSPDGQTLASSSSDFTTKLWCLKTGECQQTLEGHQDVIWSVVFNPDGVSLATGSQDETIKVWHRNTGQCLRTLQAERPYAGMRIHHVRGLTAAQEETLKALGAIVD